MSSSALRGLLPRPRFFVLALILIGLIAGGLFWVRPRIALWYHLRTARLEIERCHNQQAIRHLQICLRELPDNPEVLLLAARATRRERSYDETELLLEKYQQIRGLDDAASFEQLLLSAERNVDRVAGQCRNYIEAGHPEASLIFEALTRGYLRQYQLTNAQACLKRWLEAQPDCAQAHYIYGLFLFDYLRAQNEAEKSYRRAVELDSEHEEARLGLAFILTETKCYAEALEHIEFLRGRQPDNVGLQVRLAECRAGLGDSAEAERLLDQVLAENPLFPPAVAIRGRLALDNGDYERAETWLRRALALTPIDRATRHNLIKCLNLNGKTEEAEQQQKEIEQREKDLARFDEIITKEMPQRPRDPSLHCALGQLLLRGGYAEEGVRWLNSALRLDRNYAPAQKALSEYRESLAKEKRQLEQTP
jgi:predicted Zn-dependent protease